MAIYVCNGGINILIKYIFSQIYCEIDVSNVRRDACEMKIVYLSEHTGISFTILVGLDFFRGDGAIF